MTQRCIVRAVFTVAVAGVSLSQGAVAQYFQRTYDDPAADMTVSESIRRTNDGGYISTGYRDLSSGFRETVLCKTTGVGNLQWMKSLKDVTNTGASDMAFAVREVMKNGNVLGYVVAGTRIDANGTNHILVVRTDINANILWRRIYAGGTLGQSVAYNIEEIDDVDHPNDVFYAVTGYVDATVTGGLMRNQKIFLMKLDDNGTVQWLHKYGILHSSPGEEQANVGFAVQQTPTDPGGFFITGYTNPDIHTGNKAIVVIRTSTTGVMTWGNVFVGPSNTFGDRYAIGKSIRETPDGGTIITGPLNTYAATSTDIFLLKLNYNGAFSWIKTYDTYNGSTKKSHENYGFDLYQNQAGNYVVAGLEADAPLGVGSPQWTMMMEVNGGTRLPLWARGYSLRSVGSSGTFANVDKEVGITMHPCPDDGGYIVEGNAQFSWADGFYHIRTNAVGMTDGCVENLPVQAQDVNITTDFLQELDENFLEAALTRRTEVLNPVVDDCLGVRKVVVPEENLSERISVHPNVLRVGNPVQIRCNADPGSSVTVTVGDLLGRTVYSGEPTTVAPGESISIGTQNWVAGTYFVRIVSENYTETRSIIVE